MAQTLYSVNKICMWYMWYLQNDSVQSATETPPCARSQLLSCVQLIVTHALQPARFHCPGNFLGKNTGVSCHFLLQGTFSTQESNLRFSHLLHWQVDSLSLAPPPQKSHHTNKLFPYGEQKNASQDNHLILEEWKWSNETQRGCGLSTVAK